jgi:hypothetical protein
MTESWLLLSRDAIRRAAGNPNGDEPLELPRLDHLERELDPKSLLYSLLRDASGLPARRRRKLNVQHHAARVAELMTDFNPLSGLSAFSALTGEVADVIQRRGWDR